MSNVVLVGFTRILHSFVRTTSAEDDDVFSWISRANLLDTHTSIIKEQKILLLRYKS